MPTNIEKRHAKRQAFIAMIDRDILEDVRQIAAVSRFSVAHFLRESIIRNLSFYRRRDGGGE